MDNHIARTVAATVGRHAVVVFFALAYTFSWVSYILASGAVYFPFGPFAAAIIVSWATAGLAGLGEWFRGLLRCRAPLTWYLVAFALPVGLASIAVTSSLLLGATSHSTTAVDSWTSYLLIIPIALVDAPLWEESSWRGIAGSACNQAAAAICCAPRQLIHTSNQELALDAPGHDSAWALTDNCQYQLLVSRCIASGRA